MRFLFKAGAVLPNIPFWQKIFIERVAASNFIVHDYFAAEFAKRPRTKDCNGKVPKDTFLKMFDPLNYYCIFQEPGKGYLFSI